MFLPLINWVSLVICARDVGGVLFFPFCWGVGLLGGLFVGFCFGCLSFARCVGLIVIG